ncbi:MAG TPA: DUF5654 family protein [Candidatus Magasanikbacteria bacterium]|nr:DUF5654 family protein [Candidatus Magasanikbacteria bacterium]
MLDTSVQKIKDESQKIKAEVRRQILSYMVGAFGMIAGLAWNEAIKSLIEYIFPMSRNTWLAKLVYAVIITIIIVTVTILVTKFFSKKNSEEVQTK